MTRRIAFLALFMATFVVSGAGALETDQYATWGLPLDDATVALNAKINFEIRRAIATAEARNPGRTPTCEEITREFRRRIDYAILQPIEVWATHSSLVPRLPATPKEELLYRRTNMYGDFGPLDIGRWVPDSPTVEVNGVRFGTDKISHFFSNGWRYRDKYLSAKKRGLSDTQAEDVAIRFGILEERTGTGLLVDGVFSRGDLEANYAGMKFYLSLCDGPDPILAFEGGRWTVRRCFDWREYVTPAWDESFHVSIYAPYRWRKVLPRLLDYCGRRDDPDVVERMERYRATHRPSPNDRIIEEFVRDGRLRDPSLFTLDTNCPPGTGGETTLPRTGRNADRGMTGLTRANAPACEAEVIEEVAAREAGREPRVYLFGGAGLASHQGPAASLGWLFTRVEQDFDCHTICDLRGTTLQVEPGLDGGQLSIGYARVFGETAFHERFLATPYLALGARATILRTWQDGSLGPSGLTFLGVQGQFTVTRIAFRLGAMWHVGGGDARHDQAVTWAVGWGF